MAQDGPGGMTIAGIHNNQATYKIIPHVCI